MTSRLVPPAATALVWLAVAAGVVAWALPLLDRPTPVPPQAVLAMPTAPVGTLGLERLLGTPPTMPALQQDTAPASSRFKLLGVVAPRRVAAGTATRLPSTGLALISVDGKPARALGVGAEIEPGLRVLRVGHRQVELGRLPGSVGGSAGGNAGGNAAPGPRILLDLPPLAEASRGRPGEVGAAPGVPAPGMAQPVGAAVPQVGVNPTRGVPMFGAGMPGTLPAGAVRTPPPQFQAQQDPGNADTNPVEHGGIVPGSAADMRR